MDYRVGLVWNCGISTVFGRYYNEYPVYGRYRSFITKSSNCVLFHVKMFPALKKKKITKQTYTNITMYVYMMAADTQLYCYVDGLVQDYSNSIANAVELLQSCTKPSM